MTTTTFMTDEELLNLPKNGCKYEFVEGELLMSPAGMRQEKVGARLIYLLETYLDDNPVAEVFGSNTGYRMPSGNFRSPDVSVVRLERLPGGEIPEGFGYFAPDLAIEVLAPKQSRTKLGKKIEEYFQNGTQLVWVVNEKLKTVTVYTAPDEFLTLSEKDALKGAPVLPSFVCPIKEIFKKRSR
ncbi:MAG: Uma2 family endonuclease [candidate division KSB1 bacterium]